MSERSASSGVGPVSPLAGLTDEEWKGATSCWRWVALAAGETLFEYGDASGSMYLLISGQVEVRSRAGDVDGPPIAVRGPGAVIGELGPLAAEDRTATIVAISDAELWEIGADTLISAVARREPWATELLLFAAGGMARRLADVDKQLTTLITQATTDERAPVRAGVAELEDLRRHLYKEWSF